MHEGVMIKVLLDNGATGMFIDKQTMAKHGFKLQKLKRTIAVRNVDSTNNSRCHDLANWLSHYLYFFFFLFFSYLQL